MLPPRFFKLYKPGRLGQWIAATTVSLCAMIGAFSFVWPLGALPKIRRGEAGFYLDIVEQSWVVSMVFIGYLISPIPSAYMIDSWGRRNSLCIFIWFQVIAFGIISSTKAFWTLCVARLITGFWLGLVYTVVPVYIGECAEPRVRGILGTFFSVFVYTGSIMISLIALNMSYKMLALIPAGITAILAIILCFVPESPYYYLLKGDVSSARDSITWLKGYCDENNLNSINDSIKKSQERQSRFYDIIKSPTTRKAFIIALLLGCVQRTSGLTILLNYISVVMPHYIVTPEEFAVILNIVWIISSLVSGFFVEKFERRVLMGFSCAGSSITMLGVAIWFYLKEKTAVETSTTMWLPFVLLMIHGVTYTFGLVMIPTMIPGEIFSPEIKAKASSVLSVCLALVSGCILNVFLPIEAAIGDYMNFLIGSLSSFIGFFISIFIMIETRGISLEEIQELLGVKTKVSNEGVSTIR